MKEVVLQIIKNKIDILENDKNHKGFIVDKIDIVALKEIYNKILDLQEK